eukprot:4432926-Amphidinium_carterae.1
MDIITALTATSMHIITALLMATSMDIITALVDGNQYGPSSMAITIIFPSVPGPRTVWREHRKATSVQVMIHSVCLRSFYSLRCHKHSHLMQ